MHSLSQEFFAVEFVDRVVRISVVIEFDESESILHQDLAYSSVSFEKLLDVPLADIVTDASDVNTRSHRLRGIYVEST